MTDRPTCACHGEPTLWNKDARLKAGGRWCCSVKHRESRARYVNTEKGRATQARARARNNPRRVIVSGMYLGIF